MRLRTLALLIVLGASLIGNAVLARRSPREQLQDLRARLRHLVQTEPANPGPASGLESFRQQIRCAMGDPGEVRHVRELRDGFSKMDGLKTEAPTVYADYLEAYFETALESGGAALNAAQASVLRPLCRDLGQALAELPPGPSGERLLRQIELEAGAMAGIQDLLTPGQRDVLKRGAMGPWVEFRLSRPVSQKDAVAEIARSWEEDFGLDPSQRADATASVTDYVDALLRLQRRSRAPILLDEGGSIESYEHRLFSLRKQIAAVSRLVASMTPAQQERVRTVAWTEFVLYDPSEFHIGEQR